MVTINESECVGCGACADICPASAITIDEVAVVDQSKCVDCGTCVDECPSSAIQQ
ncbi:MAG: 4Fe-4S binding protein [Candidatus Methanomethylophilaceae archaeon]|nr:4Fe-4S binding protein [Candidatus Methanomethylophilaceae archaeon]